ncbi:MAG: class I adenylate-forming enzyme family protein [Sporichthyaceae bacterium]
MSRVQSAFVPITRYVRDGATAFPTRAALETAAGAVRTYADLDVRSTRVGNALLGLGLTRGDRVAIWMDNCLEYLDVYLACAAAGLVVVPINTRFTPPEADHLLGNSEAAAMVFGPAQSARVAGLEQRPRLLIGLQSAVGVHGLEDLVAGGSLAPLPDPAPGELLILGYTSGTTGVPKGAELTHGGVARIALTNALSCRYRLGSVHVFGMSLSFTATVPAHVLPHLMVGGTTILFPTWDTAAMVDVIARRRANFLIAPSPVLVELAGAFRERPASGASLTGVLHSASKAPAEDLAALVGVLGEAVIEGWGMTENSGGLFTASQPGDLTAGDPVLLASAGRPVPGTTVQVREAGSDGVGELWVRSPAICRGYWRAPDADAHAFDGGWFRTGDLGTVAADGLVAVVDRRADLINSGGMNIYPSEVERVLRESGLVTDLAVVGAPHSRWGQVPVAFVVTDRQDDVEGGLLSWASAHLAHYKVPRRIVVVDALPRNTGGKIERHLLVGRAAELPRGR